LIAGADPIGLWAAIRITTRRDRQHGGIVVGPDGEGLVGADPSR
jgi:hypothetical protein